MSRVDYLTVTNDNNLRYQGRKLWANVLPLPYRGATRESYLCVSPSELETILRVGASIINSAIEQFYFEQRRRLESKGYTVTPPSMWVAQLGSTEQTDGRSGQVYSPEGYKNGGTHWEPYEQLSEFADHWQAVERAGFVPHVRGSNNGAWLMLRNDKLR